MKTLKTLIPDIYKLFEEGHECSAENLDQFAETIRDTVAQRLSSYKEPRKPTLRMSNIGKADCQLWFEINGTEPDGPLPPTTKLKFLYGDIIESLVVLLIKEAGYEVTDEQKEVYLNGIKGHIDLKVNGTVVDVKSASKYAFQKFENGTLAENDAFGYIKQISGYATAENTDGAFLAQNKESGELALLELPLTERTKKETIDRIEEIKKVVASPKKPPRAYSAEPHNKSGNMKLGVNCSYCDFKQTCWADANGGKGLRTFIYSTGPVFLTQVQKEPEVFEVK